MCLQDCKLGSALQVIANSSWEPDLELEGGSRATFSNPATSNTLSTCAGFLLCIIPKQYCDSIQTCYSTSSAGSPDLTVVTFIPVDAGTLRLWVIRNLRTYTSEVWTNYFSISSNVDGHSPKLQWLTVIAVLLLSTCKWRTKTWSHPASTGIAITTQWCLY